MTKDKQAIQKMAEDKNKPFDAFSGVRTPYQLGNIDGIVFGYTAAVGDMEKFIEWTDGKYFRVNGTWFTLGEGWNSFKSTADLLTLYRESLTTPQTKD